MRPCFRCVGLRTVVCAFRSCGGYLPSDPAITVCAYVSLGRGRPWPLAGASAVSRLGGVFKNDRYTTSTTVPCAVGATHTTGLSRRLFSRLSTSRSTPPCPARGSRGACQCEDPTARNSAVHRPRCMCISRTAGWRRVHSPNGRDQGALSAPCNRSGPTSS